MKSVAIIYDKFLVQGGGERVCEMLLEAFPEARLYALNAKPRAFWEAKLGRPIVSPVFGGLFGSRFMVSALYPLAALLMTTLRVKADVVLAYSSTCGKFARLDCQKSILYSNFPNRGLYQPEKLIAGRSLRLLLAPVMAVMKVLERRAIRKFDRKISISDTSRRAMLDFADVDTEVLMPPFNEQGMTAIDFAQDEDVSEPACPYYVLVSRLEPEKDLDSALEAFRQNGRRLRVIGTGSLLSSFRRIAASNIEFLGYVDDAALARNLGGAKGLIFPSEIEYSLVPLEAVSLGTPIIAYDSPAMREIMVDHQAPVDGNCVFYSEKTAQGLADAVGKFEQVSWDIDAVKRGADAFGRPAFIDKVRCLVIDLPDASCRDNTR